MKRLGNVSNDYSNFLSLLAIDAAHVAGWRGPDAEADFARATAAANRGKCEIAVGDGRGIVVEIGGCGTSEVHREGDMLVMVEHYTGDDDADVEADLERAIVSLPTTKPKKLGTVAVESGVLALQTLFEAGAKPAAKLLAIVRAKGAKQDGRRGVLVALPPGSYDIWREELGDKEGAWGTIASRVRIVPAGTPVVKGAPLAQAAPAPAPRVASTSDRRVIAGWTAVSSMAVAPDGRAFAGENGGYGVCGWTATGELAWSRELAKRPAGSRYLYEVSVRLAGDDLLALRKDHAKLHVLDPATGATRRELATPKARAFALSPDGKKLVLRTDTETLVLAYPSLAKLAAFDHYCNQDCIAISSDGHWLAVNGHEVHVFDLRALAHVTSFEPAESPWATCFTPDHRLVTGDDTGLARIYDPATGKALAKIDGAPDRKRKPTLTAIAASGKNLAIGRDDGTVVLLDGKGKLLRSFDKHEVEQPDTGATGLAGVALAGDALWVSAGPKKAPVGLSIYRL